MRPANLTQISDGQEVSEQDTLGGLPSER